MLPLVWGLWCLTPLMHGETASAAFLPSSMERIFQDFNSLMERNRGALGKEQFDGTVDISKLPSNYHNEEEKQRKMGNATVYSHHVINKVTNNHTGEMIFSEKVVTSIEEEDTHPEKKEVCVSDSNCQKDQFCFRSLLASQCQQCKAKDMTCQNDGECCLGSLCVWGKCAEGVSQGESGTRCDPNQDKCAQGLCCTTSKAFSFPVCAPYPKEGEACQTPSTTFFRLMVWDNQAAFAKCPCAQGLECRSKRYTISTCEKPEDGVDINSLGELLPIFQPILTNLDKEEAYYDDSRQDGQLAIVSLPKGPYSKEDAGLSEDYDEKRLFPWEEERNDPNQSDFQELEQLANQMGQYFGPGFY
ncbi:dickkopf-like protein 1 [Eublepharis macularius]|uniref:Dickkopf-like protein 1 n=1 Tax=Eublepharis macularius TaxID=481883 RepID=A0AA97LDM8_EUBMA|nr:dickkopf-like protein 1 [Eublepharis macularius]